jgi:hypothetical protein
MHRFDIPHKTGCFCKGSFRIYDYKGRLFYDSSWPGQTLGLFNLPEGTYYTKENIKFLDKPNPSPVLRLPRRERNKKPPKNIIIKFGNNPAKATIFHKQNKILFDTQFLQKPLYVIWFIYYHELGHKLYKSEHKADLFAAKMMFRDGFNETQIMQAPFDSLSSKNNFRKHLILKSLKDVRTK